MDDAWFAALTRQGVCFVTRLTAHAGATVVGTSATALHTQIWTALIARLVLTYLQLRSTFGWSLSTLVALLRFQLFPHRDLWAWLNAPFTGPPAIEGSEQLVLTAVAYLGQQPGRPDHATRPTPSTTP